jgi:hypothetical protein
VYRWFLTRAMPVRDTAGRITEWYGTTTDIHDRKQAEEQLQHKTEDLVRLNAELERSNAELETFASIVSHDLKEPLRGIRNYAYFLLEDYKDTLDTEGVAKLQTLTRLTQRMEALIESLLRYSSIGRDELTPHETDLNLVVREALELLKARLEDSDVEVRLTTCSSAELGDLEPIDRTKVPLAYPVADETGAEAGAGRDHPPDVFLGPVLVVPGPEITAAVAVNVGREEPVVPGHAAPAGYVAVISVDVGEAVAAGAEHAEVGHRPVVPVEDVDVAASVAVKISEHQSVFSGESAPSRDIAVVARGHRQT